MNIQYFLEFYTAFAEDKSQAKPTGKAAAEASQKEPLIDVLSTVLRINKFGKNAESH
jgi:hypothetical protein